MALSSLKASLLTLMTETSNRSAGRTVTSLLSSTPPSGSSLRESASAILFNVPGRWCIL